MTTQTIYTIGTNQEVYTLVTESELEEYEVWRNSFINGVEPPLDNEKERD